MRRRSGRVLPCSAPPPSSGIFAASKAPCCPRYLPQRPLYARRTHLTCVVCQPGHHLYRAAVSVSERVWLQPAGIGPSVHALADWDRVDCPSRGPLGRYDFGAADFHHRADDFCRWVDPAGDVTRKPSHMGYLPAQSGVRYWVWLLPESHIGRCSLTWRGRMPAMRPGYCPSSGPSGSVWGGRGRRLAGCDDGLGPGRSLCAVDCGGRLGRVGVV